MFTKKDILFINREIKKAEKVINSEKELNEKQINILQNIFSNLSIIMKIEQRLDDFIITNFKK